MLVCIRATLCHAATPFPRSLCRLANWLPGVGTVGIIMHLPGEFLSKFYPFAHDPRCLEPAITVPRPTHSCICMCLCPAPALVLTAMHCA